MNKKLMGMVSGFLLLGGASVCRAADPLKAVTALNSHNVKICVKGAGTATVTVKALRTDDDIENTGYIDDLVITRSYSDRYTCVSNVTYPNNSVKVVATATVKANPDNIEYEGRKTILPEDKEVFILLEKKAAN
jgi:hypothetical protein